MSRVLLSALATVAVLLASCSTVRLSYDHADWLLARMAEGYADLDADQSRALRAELGDLHAWHRAQELPRYAVLFDDAARRLERGLDPGDVDWMIGAVRERSRALGARAASEFAPVLATLEERQIRQVEQRFDRDNTKFIRTQMSGDNAALLEKRSRWLIGRIEDFTGTLTAAQRAQVDALAAQFPDMPRLRLEERKRRQQTLVRLVRDGRDSAHLEPALTRLLADPDAGRQDDTRQAMQRWERAFSATLFAIERSLAADQRRRAAARMRAYATDFRVLSAPVLEAAQAR